MNKLLKKIFVMIASILPLGFVFAIPASAVGPVANYGPIASTSPDSGTCGNTWANDAFDREFSVYLEVVSPGRFQALERFVNGTFVTVAGQSPEACGKDPGGVVGAGITGTIDNNSYFSIIVTNGVFNKNAVCTTVTCDTTADFVSTVFGPQAQFTIPQYFFKYTTANNGTWIDTNTGTGDSGDITGF